MKQPCAMLSQQVAFTL